MGRIWNGREAGFRKFGEPILIQLYSDVMQKFRLAAQARRRDASRPTTCAHALSAISIRCVLVRTAGKRCHHNTKFPLAAITQRRWRCTTHGTRRIRGCAQIHGENYLFMNR